MTLAIVTVSLIVEDYDAAIAFYVNRLGFDLVEDTELAPGKRWVVVAPAGGKGAELLLARADGPEQAGLIGRQGGGRVMLFLQTDDFDRDYAAFSERGVTFLETPRHEAYGSVAVFADLYGNKWDLIAPKS